MGGLYRQAPIPRASSLPLWGARISYTMESQLISNVAMEVIVANIPSTAMGSNDWYTSTTTGMYDTWVSHWQ